MPSIAATMNSIRDSRSLPSSDDSSVIMSAPKERPVLSMSQSFDDTKERSLQHSRVEIVRLTMFRTVCSTVTVMKQYIVYMYVASHNNNNYNYLLSN